MAPLKYLQQEGPVRECGTLWKKETEQVNECVKRALVPSRAWENGRSSEKRLVPVTVQTIVYCVRKIARKQPRVPGDVANHSTVSRHCNGVRVLCIAVFTRTCQLFSCCRAPNILVNVVTTNAAINAENLHRCTFTVFARIYCRQIDSLCNNNCKERTSSSSSSSSS